MNPCAAIRAAFCVAIDARHAFQYFFAVRRIAHAPGQVAPRPQPEMAARHPHEAAGDVVDIAFVADQDRSPGDPPVIGGQEQRHDEARILLDKTMNQTVARESGELELQVCRWFAFQKRVTQLFGSAVRGGTVLARLRADGAFPRPSA